MLLQLLKDNLTTIAAIIIALTTIIGSAYAVDTRYLKVTTYKQYETNKEVRRLEDQLFALDFKIANGTATDFEKAMKERLKSQLESIRK